MIGVANRLVFLILLICNLLGVNDRVFGDTDVEKELLSDVAKIFTAKGTVGVQAFGEENTQQERSLTPLLFRIRTNWDKLSPETQYQLKPLLLRPTDPSYVVPPMEMAYATTEVYTCDTPHFRIHYVKTIGTRDGIEIDDRPDPTIPDYIQQLAGEVETTYAKIIGMGFSPPPSDSTRGGDSRYDIYIKTLPFGVAGLTAAEGETATSQFSFMMVHSRLSTNLIKATFAHEYFHAVQYGYDYNAETWWKEMTAVWMEDEVYNSLDDYLRYLPKWFQTPSTSLNTTDYESFWYWYGSSLFAKYLSETYGSNIIRDIWEKCRTKNTFTAIGETINLKNAFYDFTIWNYFTNGRELLYSPHYAEVDQYKWDIKTTVVNRYPFNWPNDGSLMLANHLSATYYEFVGGSAAGQCLWLKISDVRDNNNIGKAKIIKVKKDGYGVENEDIVIGSMGEGRASVGGFGSEYSKVILIVSNVSSRTNECYSIKASTGGAGKALQIKNWSLLESSASTSAMSAMSVVKVADSSKLGNGIIDPGETVELALNLENTGSVEVGSISGVLHSNSVEVTNATKFYGDIKPAESKGHTGKYVFSVPTGYSSDKIDFALDITGKIGGQDYLDLIDINLPVGVALSCPPGTSVGEVMNFGLWQKMDVDDNVDADSNGNDNKVFDTGDTKVNLIFYAGNATDVSINPELEIIVDPSLISLNEPGRKAVSIGPRSYVAVPFSISPIPSSPTATKVYVRIKLGADTKTYSFDISYGYLPVVSSKKWPGVPSTESMPKTASIVFDNADNMYVAYPRENKIVKYDTNNKILHTIHGYGSELLGYAMGLAYSKKYNKLLVADTYNARILVYDDSGNPISMLDWPCVAGLIKKVSTHKDYAWGLVSADYDTHYENINYPDEYLLIPTAIDTHNGEDVFVSDRGRRLVFRYKLGSDGRLSSECFSKEYDISEFENKLVDMKKYQDNFDYLNSDQAFWRDKLGWCGALLNPIGWAAVAISAFFPSVHLDSTTFRMNFTNIDPDWATPLDVMAENGRFAYSESVYDNVKFYDFSPMSIDFFSTHSDSNPKAKLNDPSGITRDSYGNYWVADTGNKRIAEYDTLGKYLNEYTSENQEIHPQKIKVKDGKIYIADANYDRPLVWNIGGTLANVRTLKSWFSPVNGIRDPLKIIYSLSQPAEVTIQLIPKSGVGDVATIMALRKGIGMTEESWLGHLINESSGESYAVTNGQYTLKIIAGFGDYFKSQSVDLNIDSTPPTVSLDRAPPAISPNGDGTQETMTIDYTISDNLSPTAEVKLSIWQADKPLDILLEENITLGRTGTTYESDGQFIWNGKIGGYLMEGNYILQLKGKDLAGNVGIATKEVLVDRQPPRIEAVKLSNPFFSPNGDGRKDKTEISFHLSDNFASSMPVTIRIKDKVGALVATLADGVTLEPGDHCFTWEANNPLPQGEGGPSRESGMVGEGVATLVPNATYTISISASDTAGNIGTCEPQAVVVDTVPPTVESLSANPNPFTPNKDGVKDTTKFSYQLSEPCNTELRIFREDGELFFSHQMIASDLNSPNNHLSLDIGHWSFGSYVWDGSGFHGEILGEDHPFKLIAEDRAGNITTSEAGTIVVDHAPSLVPYAFAVPDPFSPVNPKNNTTTIRYFLTRDGLTINASITGKEGRVVKQLLKDEVKNKGEQTVEWDGSFDPTYDGPRASGNNNRVADGAWEIKVTATASDEPQPCLTANTVLVDNVPPFIMVNPVVIDLYNKKASLTYSVPETSSVEVAVYDSHDALIKELNTMIQLAGAHTATWQATAENQGLAYFKVTAIDRALNEAEKRSELFAVIPQEDLQLTDLKAIPATFTPNGDGLLDQTRITYNLSGGVPDYKVDIDIQNQTGSTVRNLLTNDPQAPGHYSFYWDGKNDGGQVVADGYYECVITTKDQLNTIHELRTTILLISTRPTVTVAVNPQQFSPNGDGAKDTTTFSYSVNYATVYLSKEALVKLEVLNGSSEALWSKTFNHTAGSYIYEWDGKLNNETIQQLNNVEAGNYYVRATAQDELWGTAVPQLAPFSVAFGSEEATIPIDDPSPTDDPNPANPDILSPEVSDLSISPNLAGRGTKVAIRFKVNELLKVNPTVIVTQSGAPGGLCVVNSVSSFEYEAKYDVVAGYDGSAIITIEASDLAGNESRFTNHESLTIDTTSPVFSPINSEISDNLEFTKYAKEGLTVLVSFKTSEPLKFNPEVKANQETATLVRRFPELSGEAYEYSYTVKNTDQNGTAEITVSGYDLAGNLGEKITSSSLESFVIDLVKPTVAIAWPESEMIATPSPFQTNGKPGTDHLLTQLHYEISEPGYVTVSIHMMDNAKETYIRTDFNEANKVAVLSRGWRAAGADSNLFWDGKKSDNVFASPGKYAFIVDVRDRAGNLIEGKWGGTCWIQDNVLDLVKAERGTDNPYPLYFSPNGDGAMETTTAYFSVRLGITPAEVKRPERISVLGVSDIAWSTVEVKAIGTYTVRVYNSNKSQLIKTICENEELQSNKVIPVVWDGRNSAGSYVAEGTYLLEVDARDYRGGKALNNLLTLTATVDTTAPTVTDNENYTLSSTPWLNHAVAYDIDFSDAHNAYASKLKHAQYRVMTGPNQTGTEKLGWSDVFADGLNASTYTTNWGAEIFSSPVITDGTYYVSVKVDDNAGNSRTTSDVFYLKKDTASPYDCWLKINGIDSTTANTAVTLTMGATDVNSGVAAVVLKNDDGSWGSEVGVGTQSWSLNNVEGQRYVHFKVKDSAGNWSGIQSDDIIYSTPPVISGLSVSRVSFNPYLTATSSTTITFSASDAPAGLKTVTARIKRGTTVIKEWSLGTGGSYSFDWNATNSYGDYVNEGAYTLEIVATDNVNNSTTESSQTITIWDDVNISNNSPDSTIPIIVSDGTYQRVSWLEGWEDSNVSAVALVDAMKNPATSNPVSTNFSVDFNQSVSFECRNMVFTSQGRYKLIDLSSSTSIFDVYVDGQSIGGKLFKWNGSYFLSSGRTYQLYAEATKYNGGYQADNRAFYKNRKFYQYFKASQDSGNTWSGISNPNLVGQPSQQLTRQGTSYIHSVYVQDLALWYCRQQGGNSWSAKLTNTGIASNPSLAVDNADNCYVVWEDNRSGNKDVYYQKIPVNFAPVSGVPDSRLKTAAIKPVAVVPQAIAFEPPTLLSPTNNNSSLPTLRPTFSWQHRKGEATEYQLDLAKNDTFSIAKQTFTKSPSSGSPDKTDATLYNFTYSIHEFDPGLEPKVEYYWRVTAQATNEVATSEVWSFSIQPDLTLSGVTNYPNPFNPNREKTKIRYRLGSDANEVKIRIYNITGRLVTELDGTTNGEGSSIWNKYNDVEWDGKNGRGDVVFNGIYPFEITAVVNGKSVNGRGKIAVLK